MGVAVGDGGELQGWLLAVRVADLGVLQPGQVVVLLPGDHEGGQVGGVDGEEDHREEGPDAGHKPGGEAPGTVHLDGGLEEDCPDQPVGPEEGELVLLVTARHLLSVLVKEYRVSQSNKTWSRFQIILTEFHISLAKAFIGADIFYFCETFPFHKFLLKKIS